MASSRVNPLPQGLFDPVGAGLPAKRPAMEKKPPASTRTGGFDSRADHTVINALTLFIAFFSNWRIRSADTLYFSANSCNVAFSSANQRW